MNPALLKLAQFVARRPSDTVIRLMHLFSGLLIISLLWWSQDRCVIDVPFIGEQSPEMSRNILLWCMLLGVFFILRGLITACVLKHSWLRWKQALNGLALVIVGGPMMDPLVGNTSGKISENAFGITSEMISQSPWHPGSILVILGIFWVLVGLTGKGTTSKCLRYGEVVKKIRV